MNRQRPVFALLAEETHPLFPPDPLTDHRGYDAATSARLEAFDALVALDARDGKPANVRGARLPLRLTRERSRRNVRSQLPDRDVMHRR
jgi:hypothetical protein